MHVFRWVTSPWSRLDALVFMVASGWLVIVLLIALVFGDRQPLLVRVVVLGPLLVGMAVITRGCYRLFRTRQHWF